MVAPVGTLCLAMVPQITLGDAIDGGWSYWTVHVPSRRFAGSPISFRGSRPHGSQSLRVVWIDDPDAPYRVASFFSGCAA